jgi:hypothetical protein
MKLEERIDKHLKDGPKSFYDLAVLLYPSANSHRCSSNGGPPGCYMTLSAAIRRGGFREVWREPGPGHRIVYPRKTTQLEDKSR